MDFIKFNLHANINKALHICGYQTPTPIQTKTIPIILAGKDIIASAQTGTGKTAAFVLPVLEHLNAPSHKKGTRILILTPTRELANQITKAASIYGKFLHFKIISLVGGMPYHPQIKGLARGADIVVATPGRLLDHLENKRIDLSRIEIFIIDEADRMFDMGFIEDVNHIAKLIKAEHQTLLFSATLDKKLIHKINHLLKNPVRIDLSNEKMNAPKINQEFYKVLNAHHKFNLLTYFLNEKNIYKAIIFSSTKRSADQLARELQQQGFSVAALHGDLKQSARNRAIDGLRQGKIQFLIATDVAARGIDVLDLTHVINYDLPKFCEDYVHRIGRTGRAGKSGTAISFVLPSDMHHLHRIERYIGQKPKFLTLNCEQDISMITKDALKKNQFEHRVDYSVKHKKSSSNRKKEYSFEKRNDSENHSLTRKKDHGFSKKSKYRSVEHSERAKNPGIKDSNRAHGKKHFSEKPHKKKVKGNQENSKGKHFGKNHTGKKNFKFTKDKRTMAYFPSDGSSSR